MVIDRSGATYFRLWGQLFREKGLWSKGPSPAYFKNISLGWPLADPGGRGIRGKRPPPSQQYRRGAFNTSTPPPHVTYRHLYAVVITSEREARSSSNSCSCTLADSPLKGPHVTPRAPHAAKGPLIPPKGPNHVTKGPLTPPKGPITQPKKPHHATKWLMIPPKDPSHRQKRPIMPLEGPCRHRRAPHVTEGPITPLRARICHSCMSHYGVNATDHEYRI